MSQDADRDVSASLTWKYIFALTMVACLCTTAFILLNALLASHVQDAPQINLSGRQRMLSQRIPLLSLRIAAAETDAEREHVRSLLRSTVDVMERSHRALIDGDAPNGVPSKMPPNLRQLYFGEDQLSARIDSYLKSAREVLAAEPGHLPNRQELASLVRRAEGPLLKDLNRAVLLYEFNSDNKTRALSNAEFWVWLSTLALLVVEGVWIFRPMVHRTKDQLSRIRKTNSELVTRDHHIGLLLDSTGDGLLPVDRAGRIQAGVSCKVADWFGEPRTGQPFWELIGSGDSALEIELGFEQIVEGILPFDVAVSQAVHTLKDGEQVFGVGYRRIRDGGEVTGYLIVIRDITDEVGRRRTESESHEFGQVIGAAIRDQQLFERFVEDTKNQLRHAMSQDLTEESRAQILHTIKGSSSVFGFEQFAALVHQAEEALHGGAAAHEVLPPLQQAWQARVQRFDDVLRGNHDIWISAAEHQGHVECLNNIEECRDFIPAIKRWRFESAPRNMGQLSKAANRLAQRLHKDVTVHVSVDNDLRLDADVFGSIWGCLSHIVRNALDHGIEKAEDRIAAGKDPAGRLSLECRTEAGFVKIAVSDDGRGIDWERIKSRAIELGLLHGGRIPLSDVLFATGLSTRLSASEISGRGIGMSAVREAVERCEGSISVDSEPGKGTCVTLMIPIPDNGDYDDLRAPTQSMLAQSC
ncbi:MAG: ATP-binding protein [Planctomycetota bacterium]